MNNNHIKKIEAEIERVIEKYGKGGRCYKAWLKYPFGLVNARGKKISAGKYRGKRFRPRLLLLVCDAYGGRISQAVKAAAALEIFHNFSLVHDDIMDHDDYRRWRPSVWKAYGMEQALVVGDTLLVLSQLAINDLGLAPGAGREISKIFNLAFLRVAEGQHLDLKYEKKAKLSQSEYMRMIALKTAALTRAAAEAGASLATSDKAEINKAGRFGDYLGQAYQIYDDIAGIWGEYKKSGKQAGGDVKKQKKTLPLLFALKELDPASALRLKAIYGKKNPSRKDVLNAISLIDKSPAKKQACRTAKRYLAKAEKIILAMKISKAHKRDLIDLSNRLIKLSQYENN